MLAAADAGDLIGGITMNMLLNLESPVTTAHRAKLAYIYVRHRPPAKSVSIRRARAAVSAGRSCSLVRCPRNGIEVIDEDLGKVPVRRATAAAVPALIADCLGKRGWC